MTNEIKEFLEKIKNNQIFDEDNFFFIGGTALSEYLNHRVSYDIDIASTCKLPISKINAFAFSIGARAIPDKNATAFKINTGENIQDYHLKFMVDGIKLEFSHFKSPIQMDIINNAESKPYDDNSKLKILSLKDIIALKVYALFNRQKTRDLFDVSIILEENLIAITELERIYSFTQNDGSSIRDYIDNFNSVDDDGDNSLDFLSGHKYYKVFAKKNQKERFIKSKEMFLEQYNLKRKGTLESIKKATIKGKKKK